MHCKKSPNAILSIMDVNWNLNTGRKIVFFNEIHIKNNEKYLKIRRESYMVIKRRKNVVLSGTEMNEIFMDAKNDARNFAIQFIYIYFFLLKK